MARDNYEASFSSFDEGEYGGGGDEVDEVVESLEASEPEAQDEDDIDLNDIDLRLEIADYYRAILKHSFFEVSTKAARGVDRELRVFVRERMEVLLGLRAPKAERVELPFDSQEIEALKAVASKVLSRPQVMAAPAKKPTPTKTDVRAGRPQPKLARIAAPTQAAPVRRPSKATEQPKQQMLPKQQAKPAPQQQQQTKEAPPLAARGLIVIEPGDEGAEEQTIVDKTTGKSVSLREGAIIQDNGRRYKIVRNNEGTLYRRDITGQVKPSNYVPPYTTESALGVHSAVIAEQTLSTAKLDDMTAKAVSFLTQ